MVFLSPLALSSVSAVQYLSKETPCPPFLHSCHSSVALSSPNCELETCSESWSSQGVVTAQRVCSSEVQTLATPVLLTHVGWDPEIWEWGFLRGVALQWNNSFELNGHYDGVWCPVLLTHPRLDLHLTRCVSCYIILWLSFLLSLLLCSCCPSTLFLCIIDHYVPTWITDLQVNDLAR